MSIDSALWNVALGGGLLSGRARVLHLDHVVIAENDPELERRWLSSVYPGADVTHAFV